MNAENFNVGALVAMAHSPVQNYVIPGLTSWLIGAPSPKGTMRLFTNERDHQESITPHSHRFDFQCWVLSGHVRNRLWRKTHYNDREGDKYQVTTLRYGGDMGKYTTEAGEVDGWRYSDEVYREGECYAMEADQVHSIFFSRGAKVLFFEGETVANHSVILQPFAGNEVIPVFEVKPWMFRRIAP